MFGQQKSKTNTKEDQIVKIKEKIYVKCLKTVK